MIKTVLDLEVFRLSYQLAMEIFNLSRHFPKEERYSLTDQVVRSSRSISANIAEGWGKRVYESDFKKHLIYGMGSLEETKVWLYFAKDCLYLPGEKFVDLNAKCDELGSRVYKLYENWRTL
ncbi:four helix bundle protein [Terrimonas alba]|uniref:four helix bundle protein n=1 Tax=Terrimonas alba TaxID=3349636 RepID=UPI0035F2BFA2